MIRYLLRKSQMSLFSWADEHPQPATTHVETRERAATTRHLASGATVQVAPHQVQMHISDKKPVQKIKDDLDRTSENYRYRDIGHVPGSRKEIAAQQATMIRARGRVRQGVRYNEVNFDALEENPREAYDLITKENIAQAVDWQAAKDNGMEPAAGFLINKLYSAVAPRPNDAADARKDFVYGLNALQERFRDSKTVPDVLDKIKEIREEMEGFSLTPEETEEYQRLNDRKQSALEIHRTLRKQQEALWDAYYKPNGRLDSLKWQQEKRTRRGWKPDPELQEQIDGLTSDVKTRYDEWSSWLSQNRDHAAAAEKEWNAAWKAQDVFENSIKAKNIFQHPLTRGWNSFGKKFHGAINYRSYKGSDAFGDHVATAKQGKITDWSWLDKNDQPRGASQESVRFELKVAEHAERIGGRPLPKANYSTEDLKEEFNLANVQSGNWVLKDLSAAKHHTEQCGMAFQDLADILGLTPEEISMKGRLSIAFGARGSGGTFGPGAAAHYEPKYRVINLTKMKGQGSLAHEWLHFMDDIVGEIETGASGKTQFASTATDAKPSPVMDAMRSLVEEMKHGDYNESVTNTLTITEAERDHWKKQIQQREKFGFRGSPFMQKIVTAPDLSTAMSHIHDAYTKGQFGAVKGNKAERERANWKQLAVAHHAGTEGSYDVPGFAKGSRYYVEAQKIDATEKRSNGYWASTHEMLARAFAGYASDKLHSQKRENTYLVSYADNKYYRMYGISPYPEGEERTRINGAFDRFFEKMRATKTMQKAMKHFLAKKDKPMTTLQKAINLAAAAVGMLKAKADPNQLSLFDQPHHVAYSRTNQSGTVSQIQAKGPHGETKYEAHRQAVVYALEQGDGTSLHQNLSRMDIHKESDTSSPEEHYRNVEAIAQRATAKANDKAGHKLAATANWWAAKAAHDAGDKPKHKEHIKTSQNHDRMAKISGTKPAPQPEPEQKPQPQQFDEYANHGKPVEFHDTLANKWRTGKIYRELNGGKVVEVMHGINANDPTATFRMDASRIREPQPAAKKVIPEHRSTKDIYSLIKQLKKTPETLGEYSYKMPDGEIIEGHERAKLLEHDNPHTPIIKIIGSNGHLYSTNHTGLKFDDPQPVDDARERIYDKKMVAARNATADASKKSTAENHEKAARLHREAMPYAEGNYDIHEGHANQHEAKAMQKRAYQQTEDVRWNKWARADEHIAAAEAHRKAGEFFAANIPFSEHHTLGHQKAEQWHRDKAATAGK